MRKYIFLMMIFVATSAVDSTKIRMRRYLDMHDEGFVLNRDFQNFHFSQSRYQKVNPSQFELVLWDQVYWFYEIDTW